MTAEHSSSRVSEAERLAKLEVQFENIANDVHEMSKTLKDLNALMQQAKGARWALLAFVGIGGYLSGTAGQWLHKLLGP